MNRLEGKVAIITGGNSGVGAATALKFAAEGAKVVITARRAAPLEEVAAKIREAGGEVLPIVSDISSVDDAKKVVATTLETYGKIDILINNAGVLDSGLKAIDSFSDDDMNRVIDINTKGTMCMLREVSAEMAKTGYGSIVNVASVAGAMGCGGAAYVASKAAVIGLTRSLAMELAPSHIRVNCVAPGVIHTDMVDRLGKETMDALREQTPLGRLGTPEDIALAVAFLACDKASFITGQVLTADGGFIL